MEVCLETEKAEARQNTIAWLNEAEEKAEELWNKNQDQVKLYFKENDERKVVGIIPEEVMPIFSGIEDYHLYGLFDTLWYTSRVSFTSEIATAVLPSGCCDRGVLPSNDIYCSCFLAGVIFLYRLFCNLFSGCLYVEANKTSLLSMGFTNKQSTSVSFFLTNLIYFWALSKYIPV